MKKPTAQKQQNIPDLLGILSFIGLCSFAKEKEKGDEEEEEQRTQTNGVFRATRSSGVSREPED